VLILRGDVDFLRETKALKYPFALVVDSASLKAVGSVEYGEDIGSLMMRVLGVAMKPSRYNSVVS